MKKLLFLCFMLVAAMSAQAVTLFPYFVDVAGNYKEGTPEELDEIDDLSFLCYAHPSQYANINETDHFLADNLPFETEQIHKEVMNDEETGSKIIVYMSPMLNGNLSLIFLIQLPEKGFYIGYNEIDPNDFIP